MLKGYVVEGTSFTVEGAKVSCESKSLLPALQEIAWKKYSPSVHDITNENAIGDAIVEMYEGKVTQYSDLPEYSQFDKGITEEEAVDAFF